MIADLRYAFRALRRAPGFTLAVVLTLALGIGANSAIFSVVHGVLLRPLPYGQPDRLVLLYGRYPDFGRTSTSLPDYIDWRDGSKSFEHLAARHNGAFVLTGEGEPERVIADRVTSNFFPTLGVRPFMGRGFLPEEDKMGGDDRVVVLSHGYWQRRFGGDERIVGRQIQLSGRPWTVVGVAPPEFRYGRNVDLWAPTRADTTLPRRAEFLDVIGRLKPGVTVEQASADVASVVRRLAEQYPETNATITSEVAGLKDDLVKDVQPALLAFMGAVALVLLIACANVANLLLARAATRDREVAVRVALGAGRGRLVRQLLTESMVLALIGGVVGIAIATWGVAAMSAASVQFLPRQTEIGMNPTVVIFSLVLSLATGLLFGLAPSMRLTGGALHSSLREGARGATGGALARVRSALVLGEVAVALVLLVGAGLLIRSFDKLTRVDLGFEPAGVLTYSLTFPSSKFPDRLQHPALYRAVLERSRELPGVSAAAISVDLPMAGPSYLSYSIEGQAPRESQPGAAPEDVQPFAVTSDYFSALGIPLRRGRLISAEDGPTAPRVALVNEVMARRFPNGDPIGRRITFGDPADIGDDVDDHRRRGRKHRAGRRDGEAVRTALPGDRADPGPQRVRLAAHERGRSDASRGVGARSRACGRPRSARQRRAAARGARGAEHRSSEAERMADRRLLQHRAGARRRRHLRRDGVHSGTAHSRDRGAHGARCQPCRRAATRRAAGDAAGAARRGGRSRRRVRHLSAHRQVAVRREPRRSRDVHRRAALPRRRRAARDVPAGPPCDARPPHGRAAKRVTLHRRTGFTVMRPASLIVFLACVPGAIGAQSVAADTTAARATRPSGKPPVSVTIGQAIELAERNNPVHLSTLDRRSVASWQRRSAYGAFLPNVSAQFGSQYREGLQQLIAGQRFGAASDQISSSYDIGVSAQYSAATLLTPRQQTANVRAAEAAVSGSAQRLRTAVTQQYLTVLQQRARAAMQDTLLASARAQLVLAQARAAAGAVTPLDVRRAEVAVGTQEVALVQAANQAEIELLRLYQQMGMSRPDSVLLTSEFTMTDRTLQLDQLLAQGRRANPTLAEMRSREQAAQLGYRTAQSQYTPTLTVSTGWGGYTNQYTDKGFVLDQRTEVKQNQCAAAAGDDPVAVEACRNVTLNSVESAQALAENKQFPFRFQRNPFSLGATVSIPVFNGFQREQRVQEAAAARNDARHNERAQELQLETDVTSAYLNLVAARRTVALQEGTAAAAREAMRFAQERYRVGLNTFVDVAQARADRERAENDRIAAIYDYHRAFATLEGAVGTSLR